ncbi:O-antigen ligase family protein [Flavobacterium sp.]|uniref:O-antigen ligase family protein n=1 Tax=Flavobacterium sp. TaxID=239 RepID=UPI0037510EFB
MKINKSSFYRALFIVVLLSQIYLPSFKINIFLQIAVLLVYFGLEKPKLSVRLLKTIIPVFLIFILGFLGMLIYKNPIGYALKDVFHFIKPLQGILIGYFFFKTINNDKLFIKTIVKTGFISAIIHFFLILFFTNLSSGTVNEIRSLTKDNFLELIAIFFLGYYNFFFNDKLFNSKAKSKAIFIVLLLSCILYFSRTMMVGALIFFFSIKGYTKITSKSITVIGIAFLSVILLYGYLYSVKIDRSKPGLEAFLYKIKIAPEELFKTNIDRDNHEDLWDHWRGYEAKRAFALMNDKPLSYLSGTGYGSLVNLKFKAPLGEAKDDGIKYISELHNGYPYVLYKTGIIGLILYLTFLLGLYKNIYSKVSFEAIFISALGIFYLFTTLTITGIYNTNDTTVFVLGALLFGLAKSQKKQVV